MENEKLINYENYDYDTENFFRIRCCCILFIFIICFIDFAISIGLIVGGTLCIKNQTNTCGGNIGSILMIIFGIILFGVFCIGLKKAKP